MAFGLPQRWTWSGTRLISLREMLKWRYVIRVPFNFSGELQQLFLALDIQLVSTKSEPCQKPGHNRRGRTAKTAGKWDPLCKMIMKWRNFSNACGTKGRLHTLNDKIGSVTWHVVYAVPLAGDEELVCSCESKIIPNVHSHPNAIVSGAHIC